MVLNITRCVIIEIMSGAQVRAARERLGLTQQQAARRWRLSQPYVSLVEHDKRPTPHRLASPWRTLSPRWLLGCPFKPVRPSLTTCRCSSVLSVIRDSGTSPRRAMSRIQRVVALAALRTPVVPARVTEALPWLLVTFVNLDWGWLLDNAKLSNVQNRLGFLVHLAKAARRTARRSERCRLARGG